MLDQGEPAARLLSPDQKADAHGAEVDGLAVPWADDPRALGGVEAPQ
jgi:hypothetical protein